MIFDWSRNSKEIKRVISSLSIPDNGLILPHHPFIPRSSRAFTDIMPYIHTKYFKGSSCHSKIHTTNKTVPYSIRNDIMHIHHVENFNCSFSFLVTGSRGLEVAFWMKYQVLPPSGISVEDS